MIIEVKIAITFVGLVVTSRDMRETFKGPLIYFSLIWVLFTQL